MANFNSDLLVLRDTLNKLTKDLELQGQMAKTFQDSYYRLGEMILELEEHFKQVILHPESRIPAFTDPIAGLFLRSQTPS